ncbi:hypothetical protein BJ165DRAFT_1407928 [Panaeolus papilionaceus]|nr:hypothetical protein BJ165DRAFT_1407928 [Panaeolus papilionaceus]
MIFKHGFFGLNALLLYEFIESLIPNQEPEISKDLLDSMKLLLLTASLRVSSAFILSPVGGIDGSKRDTIIATNKRIEDANCQFDTLKDELSVEFIIDSVLAVLDEAYSKDPYLSKIHWSETTYLSEFRTYNNVFTLSYKTEKRHSYPEERIDSFQMTLTGKSNRLGGNVLASG